MNQTYGTLDFRPETTKRFRPLVEAATEVLRRQISYRTFPSSRRKYAETQLQRLTALATGELPGEYLAMRHRELFILRQKRSGETFGWVPDFQFRTDRSPEQDLEAFAQALATEARILEAHYEGESRYPKGALSLAKTMVEQLRAAALEIEEPPR